MLKLASFGSDMALPSFIIAMHQQNFRLFPALQDLCLVNVTIIESRQFQSHEGFTPGVMGRSFQFGHAITECITAYFRVRLNVKKCPRSQTQIPGRMYDVSFEGILMS